MAVSADAHIQIVTTVTFGSEPELREFWQFVDEAAMDRQMHRRANGITPLVVSQFLEASQQAGEKAADLAERIASTTSTIRDYTEAQAAD